MPKLRLKRRAQEQFENLPRGAQEDADEALLRLQMHPSEVGVPLRGRLRGRWRTREGAYRIIYRLEEGGQLVIVESIRPRSAAYRTR